jgi:glycosyltransferase involved in cell wall biosynthesis
MGNQSHHSGFLVSLYIAAMSKKKILLLVDWFDPFYKAGGIIRACRDFVSRTSDAYDVYVYTRCCDIDGSGKEKLSQINAWIHTNGFWVFYADPDHHRYRSIKKTILTLSPDIIYLHSMYSRCFTVYPLLVQRLHKTGAKLILLPHGMLHDHALAIKPIKKKIFLRLLRATGITRRIYFQATDPVEYKNIRRYLKVPDKRITRVPYFVNPTIQEQEPPVKEAGAATRFLFVARILKIKNLHLILQALAKVPYPVTFSIAGPAEDVFYWEDCQKLMAALPPHITIDYKGAVRHDEITRLLAIHHYLLLPSQSENFCYAIYEALLAGRPVITSNNTPWEQLYENKAGWNADTSHPHSLVSVLNDACTMDGTTYGSFCKGARNYADTFEEKYKLQETYSRMFAST